MGAQESDEFRARLQSVFKRASDMKAGRFTVEVRNKDWLDDRLTDLLRDYNVGLALMSWLGGLDSNQDSQIQSLAKI